MCRQKNVCKWPILHNCYDYQTHAVQIRLSEIEQSDVEDTTLSAKLQSQLQKKMILASAELKNGRLLTRPAHMRV